MKTVKHVKRNPVQLIKTYNTYNKIRCSLLYRSTDSMYLNPIKYSEAKIIKDREINIIGMLLVLYLVKGNFKAKYYECVQQKTETGC